MNVLADNTPISTSSNLHLLLSTLLAVTLVAATALTLLSLSAAGKATHRNRTHHNLTRGASVLWGALYPLAAPARLLTARYRTLQAKQHAFALADASMPANVYFLRASDAQLTSTHRTAS